MGKSITREGEEERKEGLLDQAEMLLSPDV